MSCRMNMKGAAQYLQYHPAVPAIPASVAPSIVMLAITASLNTCNAVQFPVLATVLAIVKFCPV
jgi:hypothetical protein